MSLTGTFLCSVRMVKEHHNSSLRTSLFQGMRQLKCQDLWNLDWSPYWSVRPQVFKQVVLVHACSVRVRKGEQRAASLPLDCFVFVVYAVSPLIENTLI